jgi:hypothetical protein
VSGTPPQNSGIQPPRYDEGGAPDAPVTKATLSRELSDFLVELSITMQKHAIYPQGHPLLNTSLDSLLRKLALLLADRPSLSIGIARRQLIIEGVATDPNHPLLKELAGRLHKHSLGAVKFSEGVTRDELGDALATIAVDAGRLEQPLGDSAIELSEKWNNVRLYPLNYERLHLLYEGTDTEGEERVARRGGSTKAAQLWVGMARAAMMLDADAELNPDSANPLVVAEAIDKRQQEQAYDQVIVGYLLQIAEELKKTGGTPEAVELQKRISAMVKQLSPETLKKLLHMGGDLSQQRQFLLNASQGMTLDAVVDLVKAASTAGQQTISHSMMRLFSKLSKYAETGTDSLKRANADSQVREQMQRLMAEWSLDDPNPTAYGKVLQSMSRTQRTESQAAFIDVEPERLVEMGFELGVTGPRFDNALQAMLNSAHLAPLLDLLDKAPDPEFADAVWSFVDSNGIIWSALAEASLDLGVIERIVKRKRLSAVEPILDAAERIEDHKQRERLLDVLIGLGDEVGPYLSRRLDGARADYRRDLFLLIGKLPSIPSDVDASSFLLHNDAAVRREAIRLMLKFVETREQAIIAGVADSDDRAVFYGLNAAQEGGCPPRATTIIKQRLDSGELDQTLRSLAIRVLAADGTGTGPSLKGRGRTSQMMKAITDAGSPAAMAGGGKKTLAWLMGRVASKSRFLRRWQLQPKSPEMLAALGALASYWNHERDVQDIIALAVKTGDPELRKAMSAQRVTGKFKAIKD